jgi:hypothetical protein
LRDIHESFRAAGDGLDHFSATRRLSDKTKGSAALPYQDMQVESDKIDKRNISTLAGLEPTPPKGIDF